MLRKLWPIAKFGSSYVVTLHDDVLEVFATDTAFEAPYKANLDVITGRQPFFLGMTDTPQYKDSLRNMREVVLASDLPELGNRAEAQAEAMVAASGGTVEVVNLVRQISFDLIANYFGVPKPEQGRLDVWGTRLFEFQFVGSPSDKDLRAQVDAIAPAFRAHIDREIARRKAGGAAPEDDVLARCLRRQAEGRPGYSDEEIRTDLLCMVVGGPPQPPMVVPQAVEQLLRRPDALALAAKTARAGDDAYLWRIVREAMRFDPLAPGLLRVATKDWTLAQGTRRARTIPKGATVVAAIASAMMDGRRVPEPERFNPDRSADQYIHFGHGLHECFGRHINEWTLQRMIKPLLRRPNLRRAPGPQGHLTKDGIFADRLVVQFDEPGTAQGK
ncbi:cytochrome P450 [Azospirillum sp. SYSU D00513]|uniref:cytochrome P450 n=1 Tax=Azospirillum sp. SYSU D00513 TaxID=2812561 RepID=UPI001A96FE6E|nr:cytochrome P450 [Azospirillum sp. SYSU D00513]